VGGLGGGDVEHRAVARRAEDQASPDLLRLHRVVDAARCQQRLTFRASRSETVR
jgi:hypothetical protein